MKALKILSQSELCCAIEIMPLNQCLGLCGESAKIAVAPHRRML